METEEQLTTLDYADLLDAGFADDHDGDIAAELRRLHDREVELVAAVVYASTEAMNSSMESPSFDGSIILESHHAASLSLALDELQQHRAAIAAAKENK